MTVLLKIYFPHYVHLLYHCLLCYYHFVHQQTTCCFGNNENRVVIFTSTILTDKCHKTASSQHSVSRQYLSYTALTFAASSVIDFLFIYILNDAESSEMAYKL